ncbi:MAG: hypothetical protein A2Y57_02270 [Candidatus Woykebacteria bacterium RBG_13_40_7b]|uniref:Terminase large subunit gp17-like C-terminal domain-containing protein n=1 Tax=Candidatus Woykebacteria bacterium RBG_13_40_7b TaxID=1802594 RepID=A0A1G1W8T7_9BACT|nr:MAG: hypothetical protein A2Y57_02270 [Candidatus Woykebacteria bacterium RBG_13_40_7b]
MSRLNQIVKSISNDRKLRVEIASRDIFWFFRIYLGHYIEYKTAEFQKEILGILQNKNNTFIAIVAFRNSAKSTFCSSLLPIWSVVGVHQVKHILIVCQTHQKTQQVLANIKQELEANSLLLADFGSFIGNVEQWNLNTIVLPRYGARITAVSVGESIRGLRHREHRPDLIICDDIEDIQSTKIKESRDKLWRFVTGELIPAGDTNTRFIFIGNLVHEDSIMMKIKKDAENNSNKIYREYPLVDENNHINWPDKYPTWEKIEELKQTVMSEADYLREYCLKIIPEGDQVIFPEDIKRYDESDLNKRSDFLYFVLSIDPAFSLSRTGDKNSIIIGKVFGKGGNLETYLLPHPINKKMTLPELVKEVKKLILSLGPTPNYKIFVEGGGTQKGVAQLLQSEGLNAQEINPQGQDKRTRLSIAKYWIQNKIYFPKTGLEELETQLISFGTERYDDLVDALTLMVLALLDKANQPHNDVMLVPMVEPIQDAVIRKALTSSGQDWADTEDQEIFRSLKFRNPTRILG